MSKRAGRPIAVVAPRYGGDVLGGAEAVLKAMAERLPARGWPVDVLTTTSIDLYRPSNAKAAGIEEEDGVKVRRFAVAPPERGPDLIGHRILAGEDVSVLDQMHWMNTGARSPDLFDYLSRHANEYHAILCAPYMAWTSFVCSELAADRTILMPCLHDEPFARLELFRSAFEDVKGIWFLSDPERALAASLYQLPARVEVVGVGVEPPVNLDAAGFCRRHGVADGFLLYAGRREWMKGWNEMLDNLAFAAGQLGRVLTLVTCGAGEVGAAPPGVEMVDLGFLPDHERWNAFAAAGLSLQPSVNESFSLSVLESWATGTPVLANAGSAVVAWHAARSHGALMYRDKYEFAAALSLLLSGAGELRADLATRGRAYVSAEYGWPGVLDRAERALDEWQ
jgi:glycosyltransferase involved in cell wall biosynthesis